MKYESGVTVYHIPPFIAKNVSCSKKFKNSIATIQMLYPTRLLSCSGHLLVTDNHPF